MQVKQFTTLEKIEKFVETDDIYGTLPDVLEFIQEEIADNDDDTVDAFNSWVRNTVKMLTEK
jgi:hypothetical protein